MKEHITNMKEVSLEIINIRKRLMFLNLLLSLFLLLTIQVFHLDRWGWAYLLYALWQFFVYGKMLYSELKTPGLNMLSLFFLGALMTVALPSFSYSVGLIEGKKFYCLADIYEITDSVFQTSAAMNVYYSLFILLLTRFSNNRMFIVDIDFIAKKYNLFYIAIFLYLIAFVFRAIPFIAMISSALDQFAGSLPLLVVFLLAIYCGLSYKKDKYYWLFIVILFIEIACSFAFGMYKGTIIIYAVMYFLYYYLHTRTVGKNIINSKSILFGAFFLFFILYIVYPFINIKRNESNFGLNQDESKVKEVDNIDILVRVLTFDYDMEKISGGDGMSEAFTGRMSAIYANAFFYNDAYTNGFHNDMLKMSLQMMTPRLILPDKQEGSDGNMTYGYMMGKEFTSVNSSSNFVGLFAGSYFWGGWVGAIVMCIINAWVLSLLLKTCFSNLDNIFSWIILTMTLMPMMRCFEESSDGGVRGDVFYLFYVLIIKTTSLFIGRRNSLYQQRHK